jgi:hypothetical protein
LGGVRCTDCVAIASGAIEGWILAVGFYLLGQDKAQGLPEVYDRCRPGAFFLGDLIDYGLAGLLVGENHGWFGPQVPPS